MITIVGKMFNWENQGLKHKSKSSMFKVQRIIGEIRSWCLNLFYIMVKEMVGKRIKNE